MKFFAFPNLMQAALIFTLCTMFVKASHAKIFAYIDSDGKLAISNTQEDPRFRKFDPATKVAFHKASPDNNNNIKNGVESSLDKKAQYYTDIIDNIAQEIDISAHLLHAVIQVESAYNPTALSPKGAHGLMQLIPETAQRFGVVQVYDPEENIRGGARYLKNLLKRFDNDLELTLAAYNAGEGAVQKYKNTIPPYPETQAYVVRVLAAFEKRQYRERNSS